MIALNGGGRLAGESIPVYDRVTIFSGENSSDVPTVASTAPMHPVDLSDFVLPVADAVPVQSETVNGTAPCSSCQKRAVWLAVPILLGLVWALWSVAKAVAK